VVSLAVGSFQSAMSISSFARIAPLRGQDGAG
jgi:hypothetical protein